MLFDRRHLFAIILISSIVSNVAAAAFGVLEEPDPEDADAPAKKDANIVLGLGIVGAMMLAQGICDVVHFARH